MRCINKGYAMHWLKFIFLLGLVVSPNVSWADGALTGVAGGNATIQSLSPTVSATVVTSGTLLAGERNPASATASYLAVRQEVNLTVISTTAAVTIGGGVAGDTHLMGVQILTALTGTCTVAGFADSTGAAQTFTIPVGSVGFKDLFGAINSVGPLVVTCSNVADDNLVLVLWRAL